MTSSAHEKSLSCAIIFAPPPSSTSPPLARWVNLWPPASFAEEFIDTSEGEGQMRRLQQEAEEGEGGGSATGCSWDGADANGLGALVFIGNLTLVFGALLLIFLLHVALVSAVESFWLAKVRMSCVVFFCRGGVLKLPCRRLASQESGTYLGSMTALSKHVTPVAPPFSCPLIAHRCACSLIAARFRG